MPGEFHGYRSLAGYSQGQEELDMTETTEHVEYFWIYSMLKLLIFILMMLYRQVALCSFVTLIIVSLKNVPLSLNCIAIGPENDNM